MEVEQLQKKINEYLREIESLQGQISQFQEKIIKTRDLIADEYEKLATMHPDDYKQCDDCLRYFPSDDLEKYSMQLLCDSCFRSRHYWR